MVTSHVGVALLFSECFFPANSKLYIIYNLHSNQPSQTQHKVSRRRGALDHKETPEKVYDSSNIYGITGNTRSYTHTYTHTLRMSESTKKKFDLIFFSICTVAHKVMNSHPHIIPGYN